MKVDIYSLRVCNKCGILFDIRFLKLQKQNEHQYHYYTCPNCGEKVKEGEQE